MEHLPTQHDIGYLLRDIAYLICHNSYFTFRNKIYKQTRGVPIGSPIAGVLAEILLREVEKQKLPLYRHSIKLYTRYVDDILVV